MGGVAVKMGHEDCRELEAYGAVEERAENPEQKVREESANREAEDYSHPFAEYRMRQAPMPHVDAEEQLENRIEYIVQHDQELRIVKPLQRSEQIEENSNETGKLNERVQYDEPREVSGRAVRQPDRRAEPERGDLKDSA